MKKAILVAFAILILALLGWRVVQKLGQDQGGPGRAGGPPAIAVAVEPVRTVTMRQGAEFSGTLLPRAEFTVAPGVSGRLEQLLKDIGDPVAQDELVAVLDSREYAREADQAQAELEVSRASLAEAQSELDLAERNLARTVDLSAQSAVAQSELDQVRGERDTAAARLQVAQAQVRQAEAALEAAQVRLEYTQIRAQWEGGDAPRLVGERFADEGAMLSVNEPIISVVDVSQVTVVVNVIDRDYPLVRLGQNAEVRADALPGQVFPGTVLRKAPVLDEASRQGRVEVLVDNPDGLLAPGMFARVRLEFEERDNVQAVPLSAVTSRDEITGVFLEDPATSTAVFVPVTTGVREADLVEIIEPLLSGRVVTLGKHLIEDGSAITVPDDQRNGGGSGPGNGPDSGAGPGQGAPAGGSPQ